MALINCPECKKTVSAKSKTCPKCGYLITAKDIKEHKQMQKKGGIILLCIFAILAWFMFSPDDEGSGSQTFYTKTELNIRTLPSADGDIIGVVDANEKLSIYDSLVNGFVLILDEDGSHSGWVSRSYLIDEATYKASHDDNSFLAYNYAEDFVKENLTSPSTAEFPETLTKKDHVTRLDASTYKIVSWVDSQNTYGAVVRSKFACTIVFEGDQVSLTTLDFY